AAAEIRLAAGATGDLGARARLVVERSGRGGLELGERRLPGLLSGGNLPLHEVELDLGVEDARVHEGAGVVAWAVGEDRRLGPGGIRERRRGVGARATRGGVGAGATRG